MRADAEAYAAVAARHFSDGADGSRIVGVDANEEFIVGVADASQVGCQHLADHAMLVPQGHKDSDAPFGDGVQVRLGRAARQFAPAENPDQRNKQIVQSAH